MRPAFEKRQSTKSRRRVVRLRCRKLYGDLVTGVWKARPPRGFRISAMNGLMGATGLMILTGLALKAFIEFRRATVETLSVIAPGNGLLAPSERVRHTGRDGAQQQAPRRSSSSKTRLNESLEGQKQPVRRVRKASEPVSFIKAARAFILCVNNDCIHRESSARPKHAPGCIQ
jgi:hypothetical protein